MHYRTDQKKRLKENQPVVKKKWVEKGKAKIFVVFTSLKAKAKKKRYFDSGIGNKTNLQPSILDFVTFGDDAKRSFMRSDFLNILGMPTMRDVLLFK